MHTRRAFARPAFLLTAGLAILALLALAQAGRAYQCRRACLSALRQLSPAFSRAPGLYRRDEGDRHVHVGPATACPQHKIPLADGRRVDLRPGTALKVDCDLRGVDWRGVNLAGVSMVEVDFRRADLRGAHLANADLTRARLANAPLDGAQLAGTYLGDADLQSAKLAGARLDGAYFSPGTRWPQGFRPEEHGAALDIAGWKLRDSNLRGRDLQRADLRETDLSSADLRGADLGDADLYRTNLTGARYDRHTRWPAGFRPEDHGAKLVE